MWKTSSFVKKSLSAVNVQYCVIHKIVPKREVSVDVDHVFIVPVKFNLNPKGDKTTKGKKNIFCNALQNNHITFFGNVVM